MEWDIVKILNKIIKSADENVVQGIIKLFIGISQQYIIEFPKDFIQKLKSYRDKGVKYTKELLDIITSSQRIEIPKQWPIVNIKEAESLVNPSVNNSRSRSVIPERKPVLRRDNIDLPSITHNLYQIEQPKESIRRGLRSTLQKPISTLGESMEIPLRRAKFKTDYNVENEKLPSLKDVHKIDIEEYLGQEDKLYEEFMEISLVDKDEGKIVRNLLGLGLIEANGLKKSTGCNTFKELVEWYSNANDYSKVFSIILYGVISIKKAEKLLSLIHIIASKKLKYAINNPNIIQ